LNSVGNNALLPETERGSRSRGKGVVSLGSTSKGGNSLIRGLIKRGPAMRTRVLPVPQEQKRRGKLSIPRRILLCPGEKRESKNEGVRGKKKKDRRLDEDGPGTDRAKRRGLEA